MTSNDLILLNAIEFKGISNYCNIFIFILVSKSQRIIFPSNEQLKSTVSFLFKARDVT